MHFIQCQTFRKKDYQSNYYLLRIRNASNSVSKICKHFGKKCFQPNYYTTKKSYQHMFTKRVSHYYQKFFAF